MKLALVVVLSVACAASTTAQLRQTNSPDSYVPNQTVASRISTLIVEAVSKGSRFLFELFDIKVRTIRFLTSLYTTDNLVLLKKIMRIGLRFGNWLYDVIPNSTAEGHNQLLSVLFPQVNLTGENEDAPVHVDPDEDIPSDKESSSDDYDNQQPQEDNDLYDDNYQNVMNLDRLIRPRSY